MKLTEIVVRRPVSTLMIVLAVIVFGITSVFGMSLELIPEMNFPYMGIITVYPTAGPEDVEKLVTKEVEGAVGNLGGLKNIASYSMENMSIVMIEYEYGTNMDSAYTDIKEKLDTLANTFPDSVQTPIVLEMDINAMANMSISVSSADVDTLLYTVEEEIVPEFDKISSVADVTVYGGQEEYIRVELLEDKLRQYGVSMNTVVQSLGGADFSIPAGEGDHGNRSLAVRSVVEYNSTQELRNIPVPLGNGNIIRLSDVANIYDSTKEAGSISRFNGQENISVSIQKRQSASAVTVSNSVTKTLDKLREEYPELQFEVVYDSSDTIKTSLSSVGSTLVLAIILSMVVLFIFLGDWKASLIIGSSMPISVLVTLILMSFMGFTLNVITMSSLVLGVGMMVDNSIVVMDSCFKSRSDERTFAESAIEGTKFVLLSIIASTATTVVVFLPLALLEGMSGQMFKPLGFTIAFSLIASLLSAMTLVPLFFTRYRPEEKKTAPAALALKKLERAYGWALRAILKKKKTVMALSAAMLVLSFYLASLLNVNLMESSDEGIITIDVDTMPGLKIERIDEIMADLEDMVAVHPDVEHYTYSVSGSGLSIASLSSSSGTVTAYLHSKRKMDTDDIVEQWRMETAQMVDCEVSINASSSMSMGGDDIELSLQGSDMSTLRVAAEEMLAITETHPDIIRATSTVSDPSPQFEVKVDPMKAAAFNYTPLLVASDMNMILSGVETVSIKKDGQEYAVWVEYPEGKYKTINDISQMILVSPTGTSVHIQDIAEVVFTDTPQTIQRRNNQYIVSVTATPTQAAKYTAEGELKAMMAEQLELPAGVEFADSQMTESMVEEFTALGGAIATAVFLVFIVMAVQFESIKHSIMVMVCIPFSLIGSFVLMFITNTTISMVSLLGILILVGTVVNNGILFVDTTNEFRKSMSVETALVHTGRHRLRAILMTTLTTVLSMVPLAIGLGSGTESMTSLGIVVIGGLTASTILTLLMLPTFYLLIDGNQEKREKRQEKKRMKREAKNPVTE